MSNETVNFNFMYDNAKKENSYPCENIEWITINDSNALNYNNAQINFNNVNITGSNPNTQIDLSQAYVLIPVTYNLSATGCTFTSDGNNRLSLIHI